MSKLLQFFTVLTVTLSRVDTFTYKSCGTSTDIAQNVNLYVDPILPQTDYTLYLTCDLSEQVNGGTSIYSITYNFIPFQPTINDLCTDILTSNISCPLTDHISSASQGSVPTDISGTTIIKNEWFNQNNDRILCMSFNIKTTI